MAPLRLRSGGVPAQVHTTVAVFPGKHTSGTRLCRTCTTLPRVLGDAAPGFLGQASYSAGRLAEFWHRLAVGDPARFQQLLGPGAECCFWAEGVHRFRAAFGFPGHLAVARACTHPNPKSLPHVLLVGEAWSAHQGWTEGALETVDWALDSLLRGVPPPEGPQEGPNFFHLEGGRCLDVSSWEARHPGGTIPPSARADLLARMDAVSHSDAALACAFYMTIKYSLEKKGTK